MPALTVPANLEQLATVNEYLVRQTPQEFAAAIPQAQLALEEFLVNVVTHAYAGSPGPVEVNCAVTELDGQVFLGVSIKDWGPAFDPFAQAPEPDLSLGVDERPIGGLGIHLVKAMAAHWMYQRQGEANIVNLYFAKPQ